MSATRKECVHYKGFACAAGIDFATVRDQDLRLPCLQILVLSTKRVVNHHATSEWITGTVGCAKRQWKPEAAPAPFGQMVSALERALEGRCPVCNEPMRGEANVGDKVYAMPCRHLVRTQRLPE